MKVHQKIENFRTKYKIHKKQQKFQISFLDWTPYFDWYFAVTTFFVLVIIFGVTAFYTYNYVVATLNDFESVEIKDQSVDEQGYAEVEKKYQNKAQVLNSLR
jgi:hypothetical protein